MCKSSEVIYILSAFTVISGEKKFISQIVGEILCADLRLFSAFFISPESLL